MYKSVTAIALFVCSSVEVVVLVGHGPRDVVGKKLVKKKHEEKKK